MTAARVFADRVIPGEGLTWDAARIISGSILVALCAQIAVPLPWTPVPITGQTFGVMLVAALLGARRGGLAMGLYLLAGSAGLPVFQPFGLPGAARLLGPTAGFLWAYPTAAFVTGWLVERGADPSALRFAGNLAAGQAIIFASGWAWYALIMQQGPAQAAAGSVLPFLPGELIKMGLVVAATKGLAWGVGQNTDTPSSA